MSYLERQGFYALLGLGLMIGASRFDYRRLRGLAPALVLGSLVLCLVVLVAGTQVNGARRWLSLGPATFQPSELAKLALAIWAAGYLARRRAPQTLRDLARPIGLLAAIFCALILLEPDLGGAAPNPGRRRVDRARSRARSGMGRAVPARAVLHVPRPVARPDGRRPSERPGLDQPRLRRARRPRARQRDREDPLPARGPHRHDPRGHRRGARPHRRRGGGRGLRGLRVRGPPARADVPGPLREAPRGRDHGARVRPGGDQPRRRARPRAADGDPAPVRLVRRLEPRRAARVRGNPP